MSKRFIIIGGILMLTVFFVLMAQKPRSGQGPILTGKKSPLPEIKVYCDEDEHWQAVKRIFKDENMRDPFIPR